MTEFMDGALISGISTMVVSAIFYHWVIAWAARDWKAQQDRLVECHRLLQEVLAKAEPWENLSVYPVRLTPEWIKAAKAAGGEHE